MPPTLSSLRSLREKIMNKAWEKLCAKGGGAVYDIEDDVAHRVDIKVKGRVMDEVWDCVRQGVRDRINGVYEIIEDKVRSEDNE